MWVLVYSLLGRQPTGDTIRYDTMYLLVLKSWRYDQLNLAHDTETKNKEKLKTKTD